MSISAVPEGLYGRGAALWSALGQDAETPIGQLALEACRTADRLDELDSVIAGKGVLNLMAFRLSLDDELETGEREIHVTIGFQNVLAEARQQQVTFANLLDRLGVKASAGKAKSAAGPAANPLDELKSRREAKGS